MKTCALLASGLILMVSALSAAETNDAPSVVTSTNAPSETDRQSLVHEDAEFRFVAVDYGNRGDQVPGFYVFSKRHSRWVRIDRVSTNESVLGRSPALEEARQAGGGFPQVGWDFAMQYKDKPFAEMPLKTSGSIVFPDKIRFDEQSQRYVLLFNTDSKIKGVETVLRFRRADLAAAFKSTGPNKVPEDTVRKLADPQH